MTEPSAQPVVVDRSRHCLSRNDISPEALKVLYRLQDAGHIAYIAGGGVRDLLLGRTPKDFDIVTDAHPQRVRGLFRNCRLIGRRFRLAHVYYPNTFIEVSTFRAHLSPETDVHTGHSYAKRDGMIIRDNIFGTPAEDAFRRDFTVNALFYNIADRSIIDYVGGLHDLEKKILRVIGDPRVRFQEDPVRMIRAVRFLSILDFAPEASAAEALRSMKDCLKLASKERMYDEMMKLLYCGHAERVLQTLLDTGLWTVLFPAHGAWLEANGGQQEERRTWLVRACRQFDQWRKADLAPSEPLVLSLLFGDYCEHFASARAEQGAPQFHALAASMLDHLRDPENRIQVARAVSHDAARLLSSQPLFERTGGLRPLRFTERPSFHETFVYFKFASGVKRRHGDLLEWWKSFLAGGAGRGSPHGP